MHLVHGTWLNMRISELQAKITTSFKKAHCSTLPLLRREADPVFHRLKQDWAAYFL